jgi:hypothetical protein
MGHRGWVFVTANPTDKAQLAHFRAGGERMRISVLPKSVGVLRTGTHLEAQAALFVGDFWGVGFILHPTSGEGRGADSVDRRTALRLDQRPTYVFHLVSTR